MAEQNNWRWVYDPSIVQRKVPQQVKEEVLKKGRDLVNLYLRPRYIADKSPRNRNESYITDIYCGWIRHFFYFTAVRHYRSKDIMVPYYRYNFARIGHHGGNEFKVPYMRHTEKWHDLCLRKPLRKILSLIKQGGHLEP